jgi:hypothetical protein
MAATCNIFPQVRTKDNRMVDSILFTNLLSSGIKRNDAISIYTKIFTTPFKQEHGDWENFPKQYKGTLDINGQPTIESVMTSPFFSSIGKKLSTETLEKSARKIEGLTKAFNKIGIDVEIKFDNTLHENANVRGIDKHNAIITLNPDKVLSDTVPHEFGHIYVDILGVNHPLIVQALEQLKGTPLETEIRERYPDLSENAFNKELVVTAIGREYASAFNDPLAANRWNFWLTRFFRAIGEALGITPNAAKVLAMDMLSQNLKQGKNSISTDIQMQRATLKDIQDKFAAEGLKLVENKVTGESYYQDDAKNIYKRLTEWVDTGFSKLYQDMKMTAYEANAYKKFKANNLDTATGRVSVKDEMGQLKEYTYKELVEHEKMMQNTKGRIYGNIVHALIQNKINPHADTQAKIDKWMQGVPGESYPQDPKSFEWVENSIAKIYAASGINILNRDVDNKDKDKLAPELAVSSKLLGIATTIDNLIEHSNGTFSIIDYKTGGLFTDKLVATYMRYGRNQITNINDTKLNRAKLEVVIRAMMVKESMGDKTTRFNNLKIVHMDKKGYITTSNIEIQPFLGLIESYFKDSANGKTEEYEKMKALGLFDMNGYMGSNRDLESDYVDDIPSVQMKKYLDDLRKVENEMKEKGKSRAELAELEADRQRLTGKIGDIRSASQGEQFDATEQEDLGWFKRLAGSKYAIKNPKIKAFFTLLDERKLSANKRIKVLFRKHDELLLPVIEQYFKDHNIKGMLKKNTKYLLGGINGLQYKELFDFMWEKMDEGDRDGYYARIIEEKNGKYTDGKVDTYTKAQYEYNKWYRDTMAEQYKSITGKVGLYRGNRPITVAEMLGKPKELDPRFMPRYMINKEEITERYGFLSKEYLAYQRDSVLSDFTEMEYNRNADKHGLPIKYFGNDEIIQAENHTLSAELAFKNFMTQLVMKDELDDIHAFGNGIVKMFEESTEQGDDMSKSAEFMKDHIMLHILDTKKVSKWSSKGFAIPVRNKDGSMGSRNVSIDNILRLLKSWVSKQAMWVKPAAAGGNVALIMLQNLNKGIAGSMAKKLGMDVKQIDYTLTDLKNAHKDYIGFLNDLMRGNEHNNKMFQFAKHFNYLPDSYDYAIRKNELLGVKNKMFDESHLYLLHSIGEEYGNLIVMAAQMRHYEMEPGKSIYDSYEMVNGELKYTGNRKLKLEDGSILTELDSRELTKLKRVSSKIHGGYRQEERVALELTAAGQWTLQFRKYLPNILETLGQGKYNDLSIGNYEKKKDEDVYTWMGRINEGRIRVLGKWIFTMMKLRTDEDYKWSNLEDSQKLQMYELMVSGVMLLSLNAVRVATLGDDDDDDDDEVKKAWNLKFKRLLDDSTQGLVFWDLLGALQNQTAGIPKIYKTSNAAYDFIFRGIIEGEKTQRGDMVGANTLMNGLPLFSSIQEKAKYWGSGNNEEEEHTRSH